MNKRKPESSKSEDDRSITRHWKLLLIVIVVQIAILGVLALLGKYVIPKYWPDFILEFDFTAMVKTLFGEHLKHQGLTCLAIFMAMVAYLFIGDAKRKK